MQTKLCFVNKKKAVPNNSNFKNQHGIEQTKVGIAAISEIQFWFYPVTSEIIEIENMVFSRDARSCISATFIFFAPSDMVFI